MRTKTIWVISVT